MGRKRRLDTVQPIDERREILTEDEPTNEKIKQVICTVEYKFLRGSLYSDFKCPTSGRFINK